MGIAVMGLVCRNQGPQLWLHELELRVSKRLH